MAGVQRLNNAIAAVNRTVNAARSRLQLARLFARHQTASKPDLNQSQWDQGYCKGVEDQPDYSDSDAKKKLHRIAQVNTLLEQMQSTPESVMVFRVKDAEMDQMGRFMQSQRHQRWLWHAIAHRSGKVPV